MAIIAAIKRAPSDSRSSLISTFLINAFMNNCNTTYGKNCHNNFYIDKINYSSYPTRSTISLATTLLLAIVIRSSVSALRSPNDATMSEIPTPSFKGYS